MPPFLLCKIVFLISKVSAPPESYQGFKLINDNQELFKRADLEWKIELYTRNDTSADGYFFNYIDCNS